MTITQERELTRVIAAFFCLDLGKPFEKAQAQGCAAAVISITARSGV